MNEIMAQQVKAIRGLHFLPISDCIKTITKGNDQEYSQLRDMYLECASTLQWFSLLGEKFQIAVLEYIDTFYKG